MYTTIMRSGPALYPRPLVSHGKTQPTSEDEFPPLTCKIHATGFIPRVQRFNGPAMGLRSTPSLFVEYYYLLVESTNLQVIFSRNFYGRNDTFCGIWAISRKIEYKSLYKRLFLYYYDMYFFVYVVGIFLRLSTILLFLNEDTEWSLWLPILWIVIACKFMLNLLYTRVEIQRQKFSWLCDRLLSICYQLSWRFCWIEFILQRCWRSPEISQHCV